MDLETQLKKALEECNRLKEENSQLRRRLGLEEESLVSNINKPKETEGAVTKQSRPKEKIRLFRDLFKSRSDVYAVRWESKTGKSGYSPACAHEWHPTLCKKPEIKCTECLNRKLLPMTDKVIYNHLIGKHTVGIYPLLKDETCWFLAVDFDKKDWQEDAAAFLNTCHNFNVPSNVERSRSGNGCHVWIFFDVAIPASLARKLGSVLLSKTLEKRYEIGIDSYDRLFPNQNTLPKGGFGNLIALPLQRQPGYKGNSVFVDKDFMPYPDQWIFLSNIRKMSLSNVKKIVNEPQNQRTLLPDFKLGDKNISYPSEVKLTLKNGIYINKEGLPSSLINQLIQLATFNNPEFYKAQKQRLSTYGIPQKINCVDEQSTYFILPRGCLEDIKRLLSDLSIETTIDDERTAGKAINADFRGQLNPQQQEAVVKLLNKEGGILSATTGFGKTVVATSLIAKRKVSTLIIVHRKQLINQWIEQICAFLGLDHKSIGQIGGGKNKPSGQIDIATIQSLNRKGEIKEVMKQYGQIIVDECHHISAFSFEGVLKAACAKYIHGLTATLVRKDGLHPIIHMQCGPVRYKVNAKKQAKNRPFGHLVIPRFTDFKSSLGENQKNIQNLYQELIQNRKRNDLIFDDVLKALDNGRSPIIITERVAHVTELKRKFDSFVKHLVVLTGGKKKRQEREELQKLKNIADDEERLIIATGKYIGEGFDDPRLDTLFLTMPVSWKGTLNQYVGRLHRLNNDKQIVQVYDYVDHKEPMFEKMYNKRLAGYKALGYKILTESKNMTEQIQFF